VNVVHQVAVPAIWALLVVVDNDDLKSQLGALERLHRDS